jgi:hypothetical protein
VTQAVELTPKEIKERDKLKELDEKLLAVKREKARLEEEIRRLERP